MIVETVFFLASIGYVSIVRVLIMGLERASRGDQTNKVKYSK